ARLPTAAHCAGIFQDFEKKSAFASSMAPAIMIADAASGNNNLLSYIVTPDHGERSVPVLAYAGKFAASQLSPFRAISRKATSFPSRIAKDAGACAQNPSPA